MININKTMKTNFTPGPWIGSEEDGLATYIEGVKTNVIMSNDRPFWIALTPAENIYPDEIEANNLLIKMAPDMFWFAVAMAHHHGYAHAYDIISKILGREVSYEEMEKLYQENIKIISHASSNDK